MNEQTFSSLYLPDILSNELPEISLQFSTFIPYSLSPKSHTERCLSLTTAACLYDVKKLKCTVESALLFLLLRYLRD